MPGLAALTAAYPMPCRSATPGKKFSMSTSARQASSNATRRPSGCPRSTAMPRLLRFTDANAALIPLPRMARKSSPRPGRSSLITSAPRSPISMAA